MASTTLHSIEAEAASYGIRKVTLAGTHTGRWRVECGCGTSVLKGWQPNSSPDLMVRNMRRQGWIIDWGRTPVCPACQQQQKEQQRTMTTNKTASLGPDPKIARRIYALLDDHFDEPRRVYKAGWSDERIAKEIDTSVQIVERIRREAYGELAEDPVVTALREDIELLRMETEENQKTLLGKLAELELRIGALPGAARKAAG